MDCANRIPEYRSGIGFDAHRLVPGRKLVLGGIEIPFERGLLGYSDADVLTHAVMDALLGALGEGDIGMHFPDSDPKYKGISSLKLLEEVREIMSGRGACLVHLDALVICQEPKLASFFPQMKKSLAGVLKTGESKLNLKATTTEGLGFTGRGEGIAAQAIATLSFPSG
ncbi:MAG: 2-C-methyl-D-erythritol 2,4-cyclodiphosphate synthase [bacterium]